MSSVLEKFKCVFTKEQLLFDEPMSRHTSFKIGGNADLVFLPSSLDDIINSINILREYDMPYFVMGNGSNLLVSDEGFRGVIIKLSNNLSSITFNYDTVTVDCGTLLSSLANTCMKKNLSGLEFAAGIPGTLGGAVTMNAGAYDGEIGDYLTSALVLTKDCSTTILSKEQLNFGYRRSIIQSGNLIVLSATFALTGEKDHSSIKCKMLELSKKRTASQPLDLPSAGSTFKRPHGGFAAKLITDSNLSGYSIGGAKISEKHNGFIVNIGNATASDVLKLIEHIKTTVMKNFNIELETEVKIIGV